MKTPAAQVQDHSAMNLIHKFALAHLRHLRDEGFILRGKRFQWLVHIEPGRRGITHRINPHNPECPITRLKLTTAAVADEYGLSNPASLISPFITHVRQHTPVTGCTDFRYLVTATR
jgi:hypothetical protein